MRSDGWAYAPRTTTVTVHEPEKEQKPVLYDAKGKPLIRPRPSLGFRPPEPKR